jgi:hypothetical protein
VLLDYRIGIDTDAGGRTMEAKVHMHGLADLLGSLGTLALAACKGRRIAVIDSSNDHPYRPFSEHEARRRGYELRHFPDMSSALTWLQATDD